MRFLIACLLALPSIISAATPLDPALRAKAMRAPVDVILHVGDGAPAPRVETSDFEARVAATVAQLQQRSQRQQQSLRKALSARGVAHRGFWVANVVQARVDAATLDWLAARSDVRIIVEDAAFKAAPVQREPSMPKTLAAIEWGVTRVRAPEVWALGHVGSGVVIAGQDSGYDWDHPALRDAYRGWNGSSAQHDHHWHDAINGGAVNACGFSSPEPCDDNNHGTHTMGTMVGDDGGANQVGVAPGARWIGCRNMNQGNGTVATYLDCFEWFLAPTNLAGGDPQPALAPHIINNSWACPPSEGCISPAALDEAIANVHAAGIFQVASAGNAGSACGSVVDPPAIHPLMFSVGATTSTDVIAGYSSRGPVTIDGSGRLKPDATAPGSSVRSSVRGGAYAALSGTSMASPHVAGVAALMMGANPALKGDPDRVAELLRTHAIGTTSTQDCGAFPGALVPNAVFGHGRIDAFAAVQAALVLGDTFSDGFETP